MDYKSGRGKDIEVDLESGLPLIGDDTKYASIPNTVKHGKELFGKISGGFVGSSARGEDGPSSLYNELNLSEVYVDVMKGTNKAKDKHKKASNNKAPKPPRPPRGPSLDAADHKLIREISELAMLKRARVERIKALKKMRNTKPPSSNTSSSMLAMIFTVVFFVVIIFQGMSSGKPSVASFQGSPVSGGGADEGLISVQYQLNPSSDSNAHGSDPPNFVQQIAGSDFPERLRRE